MRAFGIIAALGTALLVAACSNRASRPAEVASRRAAMPAPGEVRLLYRALKQADGSVEHTWTILGERNWTKPGISGTTVSLGEAYPLNSVQGGGGTHVWECTIRTQAAHGAHGYARISLRGSHAGGISATVSTDRSASPPASVATPLITKDLTQRLPVEIRLARLNGQDVVLKIDR